MSIESAIVNLLLGHVAFSWERNGIVDVSGFRQFSFVSVNPIIVGCSRAVCAKRSLRRVGFVGRPLIFCRRMRSWVGGRGRIGVGPHVMFVLSVSFVCVGGSSFVSVLLLVVVCRNVVVLMYVSGCIVVSGVLSSFVFLFCVSV